MLFMSLRNIISCGESIEFKFHFKNCAKGNLSHQRKTCFLGSCLFEDYFCFLRDSLDEGKLAKASLKPRAPGVGGRGKLQGTRRGTPLGSCVLPLLPSLWLKDDFYLEQSMLQLWM
ncbi:unnamed protein product [Pipistrellus nathusii]|uniref:Uncharacterized protein n=1 Tax=Pipistrellus nathusii TaxID=59473 RepID=A0ABN9ZA96_PIPNA